MRELGDCDQQGGKAKIRCVIAVTAVDHRVKIPPNNVCWKAGGRNIYPLDQVLHRLKVKT